MKKKLSEIFTRELLLIVIAVLVAFSGYGWYYHVKNTGSLESRISELEQSLTYTELSLKKSEDENFDLNNALVAEKERVGSLAEQVGDITGTVGDLTKLSQLDPELLQKYSKVYFLNENYVPDSLTNITPKYLYIESVNQQIHSKVWPFLKNLLNDAEADGVTIYVSSAYRSFDTQSSLKSSYKVIYGSGANAFSADQGYSEHQLGTTVDLITTGLGGQLDGFQNTAAYQWLLSNAYKYGFVLSYPQGNSYYIFEPWHWRFVGTDLARRMHDDNVHFYDLPQREIDTYLLNIFD